MKLHIIGEVISHSGYARHAFNLVKAMVKLLGEENVSLGAPLPQTLPIELGWLQDLTKNDFSKENILMITRPETAQMHWNPSPKGKFMQYCVFEGTRIPTMWTRILNDDRIDLVICPSTHSEKACRNAGVTKDILVAHHGYDPTVFYPDTSDKEVGKAFTPDEFTFLFSKGWIHGINDRSGLNYLLKAYGEEFTKKDKVALVIKINTAYGQKNFQQEVRDLDLLQKHHKLAFVTDNVTEDVLRNLYSRADCFVMPSMSEGFGLPALESLACGTPVITTNFGGQLDFVNNSNGWLVGGELVPVPGIGHGGNSFLYEETEWLQPSIKELRIQLREAYEENSKCLSVKQCVDSIKHMTWEATASKILEVLK